MSGGQAEGQVSWAPFWRSRLGLVRRRVQAACPSTPSCRPWAPCCRARAPLRSSRLPAPRAGPALPPPRRTPPCQGGPGWGPGPGLSAAARWWGEGATPRSAGAPQPRSCGCGPHLSESSRNMAAGRRLVLRPRPAPTLGACPARCAARTLRAAALGPRRRRSCRRLGRSRRFNTGGLRRWWGSGSEETPLNGSPRKT